VNNNGDHVVINDRERVERWVEDSQYVIGRLIPGLLEDRDRWRLKAEAAEQEGDRLRFEVATLRKEIAEREAERQQQAERPFEPGRDSESAGGGPGACFRLRPNGRGDVRHQGTHGQLVARVR